MKVAALLGKDKSGKWSSLDIAEGNDVQALVGLYKDIVEAAGVIKKGKTEIKLSEMRLLCNNTSGGELKARKSFR